MSLDAAIFIPNRIAVERALLAHRDILAESQKTVAVQVTIPQRAGGLASGVPIKATVVRSVSGRLSAPAARPMIGIIFVRRDLHALAKRKADKSHEDDKGEKRS
jgi:hypothetical protein